jgi:hypothetical protein
VRPPLNPALNRALTAALTTIALLGIAAAPAGAALLTLHDPSGDMWQQPADGSTTTKAPNSQRGDVLSARIRYAPRKITVTTRYVDVARAGRYANYTTRLQSGQRMIREVTVETGPGSWKGHIRVFRGNGDLAAGCHAGRSIDYTANTVQVTVPASCLNRPRFVRANINDSRANANGTFFLDNPQNQQAHSRTWTHWIHRH